MKQKRFCSLRTVSEREKKQQMVAIIQINRALKCFYLAILKRKKKTRQTELETQKMLI